MAISITHKKSATSISHQMCVLEHSVRRYLKLFQQTGDVSPRPSVIDHRHYLDMNDLL